MTLIGGSLVYDITDCGSLVFELVGGSLVEPSGVVELSNVVELSDVVKLSDFESESDVIVVISTSLPLGDVVDTMSVVVMSSVSLLVTSSSQY